MILLTSAILGIAIVAGQRPDTVRARVIAVIGEDEPKTPFLLGGVSSLALDDSGRVYVGDFQVPRIVVFGSGDGAVDLESLPVPLSAVNGAREERKALRLPEFYPAYRWIASACRRWWYDGKRRSVFGSIRSRARNR